MCVFWLSFFCTFGKGSALNDTLMRSKREKPCQLYTYSHTKLLDTCVKTGQYRVNLV